MSFDALFHREYDYDSYNCLHFTVEAWRALFGIDLSFLTQAISRDGAAYSLDGISRLKTFRRLTGPQSPCLCLMRGLAADETHIATFLDGRVLHITEMGVQHFLPEIVFTQYKKVLFYEYACDH